jgi:hypothetical protein
MVMYKIKIKGREGNKKVTKNKKPKMGLDKIQK